jgi:YD repeat-containing protein
VRTWQYNEYGWLTSQLDGNGDNVVRYAYDANGRVTSRWTPAKGATGYGYDAVGNRTRIVYPRSAINYAYDALNRLTNMVDAVGTTAFTLTPAGQLASETGPWANDTVSLTYAQQLRTG